MVQVYCKSTTSAFDVAIKSLMVLKIPTLVTLFNVNYTNK